jgi:hypothetical protein
MTFWGGSGSGSADPCRHSPSRRQQKKTNFLTLFFCLLLFEATFLSFFKNKKLQKITK